MEKRKNCEQDVDSLPTLPDSSNRHVGAPEDVEEIHTVPMEEEPSSELRRYARNLVRANLPFLNWALDTTLRGHLRHLRHLFGLNAGVQLAMLGEAVLAFREDFQRSCPSTMRRIVRVAALPQAQAIVRMLGSDYQVLASILEAVNSTVIPTFIFGQEEQHQRQREGEDLGYMRLESPFEALRDADGVFGLALASLVDGAFLRARSALALALLVYLLFFSRHQLVTAAESLRLLEALGAVWSVAAAVVARTRAKLRALDVSDAAVRECALGGAVATVAAHLYDIGLQWVGLACLAAGMAALLPTPSELIPQLAASYPDVSGVRGGPTVAGLSLGLLLCCLLRRTNFAFRLFKLSLHLIIHSLLRLVE